MTARKLATPTNAELDANPERLRIVAKSNVEKAFYEADSKERLTDCLNTTTIRVLAAMLGELTGKSYDPNEACKEYWVARVAEYFIHIRKVRLHEKFRTHSISEIQNNSAHAEIAQTVKYAFIPGKVYAYRFSCSVDPSYCKITAKTDKTICYVKYNCDEITRAKLRSDNRGEYFYVGKSALVHADDLADAEIASRLFECTENTPNPCDNNTPTEIAQPEALYMDDSFSDATGDNSCQDQDIPEYREPETILTDNNPLHHLKPCPNCRSTHIPFLKRCDDNNFSTATRRFNSGIARQHIYYRLKCRDCGHEVKATIYRTGLGRFVIPHQNEADVKNEVCLAWNKQYDDNPGITIVPSDEIEKPDYTVYPEPIFDECPYVTVSACDKPENTPRRNHITEAKFKWVNQFLLAVFFLCKFIIPVMYAKKYNIRDDLSSNFTKFTFNTGLKYSVSLHDKIQFITINDRRKDKFGFSWLDFSDEDNISYSARVKLRDDGYTELLDFKEFDRPCYAFEGVKPVKESNRVKYVKFEVGKSYSAVSERWGHHERHITVIDRFAAVPSDRPDATHKTIYIKVRMSGHAIKADYVECWISCYVNKDNHTEEYSSLPELIFRADNPDAVKEIPAEINDITPETKAQPKIRKHNPAPASDIEHKLIDTKDLHFAEKRKALDHNAAVISSCMFSEAVISLLSSISLQAILQLGFHMRLFIAKPKGKKNVIAELFAKRLIDSRELRPNVGSVK